MMFESPSNSTPLDLDEIAGLIPDLKTQDELNEFEQSNIAQAVTWAGNSRKLKKNLLSITALQELHRHMFSLTWAWAGCFRTSDKNIGVAWTQVSQQLQMLCDNTKHQIQHHSYSWNELATRFHHRLVFIHPFPNGNGRHARLATDLLLSFNRQPAFTWGRAELINVNQARSTYIGALKEADAGNITPLLAFVSS